MADVRFRAAMNVAAVAAVDTEQTLVDADSSSSPMFLTSKRLEQTPWPARHLVDLESYKYEIEGYRATSLIAQLGCPFNCGFCGGRQSPMHVVKVATQAVSFTNRLA